MQPIEPGDLGRCARCGYERVFTEDVLSDILHSHFPKRPERRLYDTDLARFKCTHCGAKAIRSRKPTPTTVTSPAIEAASDNVPVSRSLKTEHSSGAFTLRPQSSTSIFCRQCGGDGGAGGRCPRCGGNGIEP